MRAKDYLSQVAWIQQEIDTLAKERESIFNLTVRRPIISDMKVQSSGKGQGDDIFATLADYAVRIANRSDDLIKLKIKISEQIEKIEDPTCRQLLRYRYTIGFTWEKIAEFMGYDLRWVYRLHGKALHEFEKAIKSHQEKMILL
ncbi:DUF1492 domain-containing protein [Facklamia sp. P13069]|uniref:DUF1492 domain-containing protein n=1 Tax=Facklamia sp. P13069 TaxID=3421954 RepID=UPI003D17488B